MLAPHVNRTIGDWFDDTCRSLIYRVKYAEYLTVTVEIASRIKEEKIKVDNTIYFLLLFLFKKRRR